MSRWAIGLLCLGACASKPAPVATLTAPAKAPPALAARFPLPSKLPARYLRTLEHDPGGYDDRSPPGGPTRGDVNDLLLGDLLYHAPSTLGPRARALGLSCQSCHPNGAANTVFSLENLSDRPGNIDVSTPFFRRGAADGLANPLNIPSLRGARFTGPYGHDGRTASLAEFTQGVITTEFGGDPLPLRELNALVRYVQDLDFLPNQNLDAHNVLSTHASEAAQRGETVFLRPMASFGGMSCATCHTPSTFFRDGRIHRLGSVAPPVPHALDDGQETPSLLGTAETAPYFHDGRFATLREVVRWFDRTYQLQLSAAEQDDLLAYITAVGAVDRPSDDRPLPRRLNQTFAYAALASDARASVRSAAIEALLVELSDAPPTLAARAELLRETIRALPIHLAPVDPREARALQRELGRFAADWGGVYALTVTRPTPSSAPEP